MTPEELTARGYRRVSYKFGIVSRIDRPDYLEVIAKDLHQTVEDLSRQKPGLWEDQYRRVYSKDTIELGRSEGLKVPSSNYDPIGFVEAQS